MTSNCLGDGPTRSIGSLGALRVPTRTAPDAAQRCSLGFLLGIAAVVPVCRAVPADKSLCPRRQPGEFPESCPGELSVEQTLGGLVGQRLVCPASVIVMASARARVDHDNRRAVDGRGVPPCELCLITVPNRLAVRT
jgi:hypothetical protein